MAKAMYEALQRFTGPFLALWATDRCTGWTPPLICPVIRKSKQSLNGTHRVTFVTNPVISHESWKQDGIMMKTAVALLFHNRWFWYHSKYFVRYFYRIFLWQRLKLRLLKYVIITYFHFKHISKHLMEIQNF